MVPMKTDVFFNLTFYPIKLILDTCFFNFANKEMCLIINLLNASFMVYIGLDNHIFASQKELKLILINLLSSNLMNKHIDTCSATECGCVNALLLK